VVSIRDKANTIQVVIVLFRSQPTMELQRLISNTKEDLHIHLHKTRIHHKAVVMALHLPNHTMAETTMSLPQAVIHHKDMTIRNNSISAIIPLILHKEVIHLIQQKVAIRPILPRAVVILHQPTEIKIPMQLILPALKDLKVPTASEALVKQHSAPWEVGFWAIR